MLGRRATGKILQSSISSQIIVENCPGPLERLAAYFETSTHHTPEDSKPQLVSEGVSAAR